MFNGEIYNFLELKKELSDNYNFVTSSDTEVLMFAYKKWGLNFLKKIQGMFSIAIYDKLQEKIMLVRDPIGIKPLFYALNNNQIIFSSEIKSILNTNLIKKELNPTAIDSYLMFLCAIDNLTPFNNIFKLRPGELMTISLKDKNFKNEYY
jgi:asparagine synthase (glutamine-hydrolysing)